MTSVALEPATVTTEYNGWRNRETWLVNLWLSENMEDYEFLRSICKKPVATWVKAEELEGYYQDLLEEMYAVPSFWSDILGTALDRVDWYRIIEANLE